MGNAESSKCGTPRGYPNSECGAAGGRTRYRLKHPREPRRLVAALRGEPTEPFAPGDWKSRQPCEARWRGLGSRRRPTSQRQVQFQLSQGALPFRESCVTSTLR